MELINIKPDRYYSDGKTVRKVMKIVDQGMVYYCTCEFFEPISESIKFGVGTPVFMNWAKFEVVPNWAKVVR